MNVWLDGIMGLVTGDALGCPVQFLSREEIAKDPVVGMEGYGTFNMPPGTWTDDSSLTIALMTSLKELGKIDLDDIMTRFSQWLTNGEYTPFGRSFDIGRATRRSIVRYLKGYNVFSCGGNTERDNGNGSLMRIMPACIFCKDMSDDEAVQNIHEIGGLTHNHLRAKIACGLYYFIVKEMIGNKDKTIKANLNNALNKGKEFYKERLLSVDEMAYYDRVIDFDSFINIPINYINGTGYVVDAFEAAVWCLANTSSFKEALLTAVNLGMDTDTVAAITGGVAGLYYGYDAIPEEWLSVIQRRNWIEKICEEGIG